MGNGPRQSIAPKRDPLLDRVRAELACAPSTAELAARRGSRLRRAAGAVAAPAAPKRTGRATGVSCAILAALGAIAVAGYVATTRAPPAPTAAIAPADESPAPLESSPPSPALGDAPPARAAASGPRRAFDHFVVLVLPTGHSVEVDLKAGNEADEASERRLRHELRAPSGPEPPIDRRVVELLHQIAKHTGGVVQVVSGVRGAQRDPDYHAQGMALDIRAKDMPIEALRDLARAAGATGIGYYPGAQFVHVDVRERPAAWTDSAGAPTDDPAAIEEQTRDPAAGKPISLR